jgi:hypothetical protein
MNYRYILKGFRFIWVFNMTTRTKYAFWIAKIARIFSESTRGIEMLPGRNVPNMTLKKNNDDDGRQVMTIGHSTFRSDELQIPMHIISYVNY